MRLQDTQISYPMSMFFYQPDSSLNGQTTWAEGTEYYKKYSENGFDAV